MSWDESKDTNQARPNVPSKEKITSGDWNDMVADQKSHSSRHESGGVDTIAHDSLVGFIADEHVAHSAINITAGAGLTGGGSIDASRTIDAHTTTVETSDYTASETDVVLADASAGPLTVTLPNPSLDIDLHVKKIDSSTNNVILETPNTETIDGDATKELNSEYLSLEITSDGSDYFILY